MRVRSALAPLAALWFGIAAQATPSQALDGVVASIKPVHSLAAAVMRGVSEPALIVRGTGSAHAYSLRPSDAAALEAAGVVFWVGPHMETFLREPIATLAADARVVALEDAPGLTLLEQREGGPFEAHDHGEDGHAHDHDDDDADDAGHHHDDDAAHGHDDQDHDDHAHGEHDMHF